MGSVRDLAREMVSLRLVLFLCLISVSWERFCSSSSCRLDGVRARECCNSGDNSSAASTQEEGDTTTTSRDPVLGTTITITTMERVEVGVSEIASVPDLSSVATSTPDTIALDLSTTDGLSTTSI